MTSARVIMYTPKGVRVDVTIEKTEEHTLFESFLHEVEDLTKRGWAFNEPGLNIGEKSFRICGWTMATKKNGEECVQLFNDHLKYQIATVWKEDFEKLHFDPYMAEQSPKGMSNERETLLDTPYWNKADFEIVMDTPNDKGYMTRFVSVIGHSPHVAEEARHDARKQFEGEPEPAPAPDPAENTDPDF